MLPLLILELLNYSNLEILELLQGLNKPLRKHGVPKTSEICIKMYKSYKKHYAKNACICTNKNMSYTEVLHRHTISFCWCNIYFTDGIQQEYSLLNCMRCFNIHVWKNTMWNASAVIFLMNLLYFAIYVVIKWKLINKTGICC